MTTLLPSFTTDRRPICRVILAAPHHISPDDPRGWSELPPTWQSGVIAISIAVARELNAQGMIWWDDEGADKEHYLGSPDLADVADGSVDAAFHAWTAAGLKTGCTIRCEEWNPVTKMLEPSSDPYATMLRKMKWAYKRWGCRIFYIDTNFANWRISGVPLPPIIFAALRKQLPGILIIPERGYPQGGDLKDWNNLWMAVNYYRETAVYLDIRNQTFDVPIEVQRVVPKSLAVLSVTSSADLMRQNMTALKAARARGTIMLVDAMTRNECVDPLLEVLGAA